MTLKLGCGVMLGTLFLTIGHQVLPAVIHASGIPRLAVSPVQLNRGRDSGIALLRDLQRTVCLAGGLSGNVGLESAEEPPILVERRHQRMGDPVFGLTALVEDAVGAPDAGRLRGWQ